MLSPSAMIDYRRTLESVCWFDCPGRGQIEVSGKDAASFLHNLSTNDINSIPLGGGCEAYFCDHRAKTLGHAFIYHVLINAGQHAFWLDVESGHTDYLLKHLNKHWIAENLEIQDRSAEIRQVHLAGPKVFRILEQLIGSAMPPLTEFLHMERTIGSGALCHLRRRDPLGVPGFDIACRTERFAELTSMLQSSTGPSGCAEAWESLRLEAGTPIFGVDIDDNRFVMEVARALRAVSYSKGCYLGQEPIVMARDRAGHVNRAFLGVRILDGSPLKPGTKLKRDSQEVGVVTSSGWSVRLNANIALGYLRRGHQDPGLQLQADGDEGPRTVEVLAFPPVTPVGPS